MRIADVYMRYQGEMSFDVFQPMHTETHLQGQGFAVLLLCYIPV